LTRVNDGPPLAPYLEVALSTSGPTTAAPLEAETAASPAFLRIGELARRSNLPLSTVRHYANEGLLGAPHKTSRNMAYYPPEALERIALVKTLQDELYLPLKVVKKLLEAYQELEPDVSDLDLMFEVRDRLLERHPDLLPPVRDIPASATAQLELDAAEVDAVEQTGIVNPRERDGQKVYDEVDYRILRALSGVRSAGLSPDLARPDDLSLYAAALRKLAELEAVLFARRVGRGQANTDLDALVRRVIPAVNEVLCALHEKFLLEALRAPRASRAKR
jgi:DNA-binding transcriptional MerR regulator